MIVTFLQATNRFDNADDWRAFEKYQVDIFEKAGFEVRIELAVGKTEEELIEMLKDADVAYCSGDPPITRYVIEHCPNLKVIQRDGIGVNSIDLDAATENNILVMNIAGYCIEELAVHATSLLLANMQSISFYDSAIRNGEWPKGKGHAPRRLSTLTLGVYGFGGSGMIMSRIWKNGFLARVIAYDPFLSKETAEAQGIELVDFDKFCGESDLISIHAPLTADTFHAFNAEAFSKMKPNVIIANTSRGPVIDESALAEALKSKRIFAAGLDTFEEEPLPKDAPILDAACNTVLTPHSAFKSVEASEIQKFLASNIPVKILCDKVINRRYVANPKVLPNLSGYQISSELLT